MTLTERTILLIGVQLIPLAIGYFMLRRGIARESWARPLSKFVIAILNTPVNFLAAWILPHDPGMVKLPIVAALFGVVLTGVSFLMARLHLFEKPEKGGYILASVISNYGFTMAGFVCLLFINEIALSMQTVFVAVLIVFIFLVWFPIARYHGSRHDGSSPFKTALRAFTDLTTLPLYATILGLILNFSGVERPGVCANVNQFFVYFGTAASTFTIGITLHLQSVLRFPKENLSMAATKFIIAPMIGLGLAFLFCMSGPERQVVLICASVPVGLFSSFAASLFGLNRNLTNSLFLLNTGVYLFVVLPVLVWLLPLLA